MSKVLFGLFVLLVCTMADPLQEIKAIVQQDQCGMEAMQTLRPQMENQIALLKEVPYLPNLEPRKYGSQNQTHRHDPRCSRNL